MAPGPHGARVRVAARPWHPDRPQLRPRAATTYTFKLHVHIMSQSVPLQRSGDPPYHDLA